MARFLSLAVFACCLPLVTGVAYGGESAAARCAEEFHTLLKGEPSKAFAAIKPLRDVARGGDERLPGRLLFGPSGERRTGDEVQALRVSTALAKGQGRPAWVSSANSRWIVDRVITDLTDFMGQGPSPYLCGGVENYVATLRKYVDQVSVGGGRSLEDVRAAQAKRTRNSIDRAHVTMRPVPAPRYAPELRPIAVIASPLKSHPSFTLRRGFDDTNLMLPISMKKQISQEKPVYGPRIDPGLPIRSDRAIPLDTDQNRLDAVEALVEAAVEGGFLKKTDVAVVDVQPETAAAYRPVLSRLENLRPMLIGTDVRIDDRWTRKSLSAALSEIEILDYLAHADTEAADPLISAINAMFAAVLEARQTALSNAGS